MQGELSASASPADNSTLHPLATTVPLRVAGQILHVGRSKLYDLLGLGKLKAVKDGPKVMVLVQSIKDYQQSLPVAKFAPPKSRLDDLAALHERQRQRAQRKARA
jgi:hypothetical protein